MAAGRWLIVAGSLIIQISLGAVYIWSVFQIPLLKHFPAWKETHVTIPAQVILACFALAVIVAGKLQDRFGPRPVAISGGFLLGTGLILARFTEFFNPATALLWLVLTYSVLGGLGIGTAYVCPIAACVKWFPDRRGLVTGLAVAGFGAGAFFFAPLARGFIDGGPYSLLGVDFFSLPKIGLFNTFMVLGVIFLFSIISGGMLLENPVPGYRPPGWNPPDVREECESTKIDFTPGEMVRTRNFIMLWFSFFIGSFTGLMVIMKVSPIWQTFALSASVDSVDSSQIASIASAGAMAVSIMAISNSLGRIIWGKISDVSGRERTLIIMFLLCGFIMIILNQLRDYPLFLVGISIIGLCFGGYLAVFPSITADYFGAKNFGANYGWMFSAYGAGGIMGPFLAALLMRTSHTVRIKRPETGSEEFEILQIGDYYPAFVTAGILCLLSAASLAFLKRPRSRINQ